MKISEIKIKNLGGIDDMSVSPEELTVLIGKNGSGKTSFLKALKFGLVGDTKSSKLVKDGCAEASVEMTINGQTVEKTRSSKGTKVRLNGKTTTQKSVNEFFSRYGASPETVSFVTSTEVFENCSSKEFGEYLINSGFIPLEISIDEFVDVCRRTSGLSEQCENELRSRLPSSPAKFTLEEIGALFKLYDDKRRISDKEVSRLATIVDELQSNPLIKELIEKSVKRSDVDAKISKMLEKKSAAEMYAKSCEATKRYMDSIATLEAEIKSSTAVRPNLTAKKTAEANYDVALETKHKASKQIAVFKANNEQHEKSLVRLKSDKCPLSDVIVCKQDKSGIIDELETVIYNNNIEIEYLEADIKAAEKKMAENKSEIEKILEQEKLWTDKLNKMSRLDSLKANKPPQYDKEVLDADFEEKLEKLKKISSAFNQIDNLAQARMSLKKEQNLLKFYTEMAVITSPKGDVCSCVLENLLSVMVEGLNETASRFCPHLVLSTKVNDGKVTILCNGRDYNDASTGEKLLVQFLVMHQINNLSGLRILVLDNLDKLDSVQFEKFIKFLDSPAVRAEYDNIFVATVDHEDFINVLKTKPSVRTITM